MVVLDGDEEEYDPGDVDADEELDKFILDDWVL